MESTNSTAGACSSACARMRARSVSPRNSTSLVLSLRRSARKRTCAPDSSPDTYSARLPLDARRAATCSRSVDLPMPGSPPMRMSEPGTMPPPSTKSNSSRSVAQRASDVLVISPSGCDFVGVLPCAEGALFSFLLLVLSSSTSVFHALHAGHCPCQRGLSLPQSVQKKAVLVLAIDYAL